MAGGPNLLMQHGEGDSREMDTKIRLESVEGKLIVNFLMIH